MKKEKKSTKPKHTPLNFQEVVIQALLSIRADLDILNEKVDELLELEDSPSYSSSSRPAGF